VKKRRRGCAAAVGLLGTIAVVLCGAVVLLGPFDKVKRHWGFVFDQWGYTQVC